MSRNIDYSLYLVTDRGLMSTHTVEHSVELAIQGGCTLVQLREKTLSSLDFYRTAVRVKAVCDRYKVPLLINDRVDIALAVDAAGVHVGQTDLPAGIVRGMIGEGKLLGVSASDLAEALQAERDGADYIGVGAMFATGTKADAKSVSMNELKEIRTAIRLPIVAIGGINPDTIPLFQGMGIDGIAVVSAIVSEDDIALAAKKIKDLFLSI
ncbi:Thiamine-phosphate synthase [Paenibacillus sp. CECT 9249]|uniref:thiamine phosphate synthase n=1 Tax=Paenibacillus sp. CECT 9249 TaxID=2845385 RepID=UPI001E45338C|nr:thiamine phosphate synthase [Paenibacillus sp. CECT 9249]CAH0122173.1 Thiamine-phosphate synthase [Paenibacillus sp. CECT 9249]